MPGAPSPAGARRRAFRLDDRERLVECRPGASTVRRAELRALLEPALGLRRRTQPAGEPDLAERGQSARAPARPARAEAIASAIAEVGAGLVDADAAGDVDEDVRLAEREPGVARRARRRSSPAASGRRRCRPGAASPDRSARRAPGSRAGSAAFPRARRRRRRRSRPRRVRPKSSDGSGTPTRPAPVISKTPSSFVEPKRFFAARRTRCAW